MSKLKKNPVPIPPRAKAYTYKGKVYCASHLPKETNPKTDPQCLPISYIGEWKAVPQCAKCGKYHTEGVNVIS